MYETPYWKISDEHFAYGFAPEKGSAKTRQGDSPLSSGQGFHAKNLLIIIDEATGVANSVWDQIFSMATSGHCKIVAIGNPTSKHSKFYSFFKSPVWKPISLTAFDSPNLIDNKIFNETDLRYEVDNLLAMSEEDRLQRLGSYRCRYPEVTSVKWVMTMAMPDQWGIDSIPFRTRVLGQWPEQEDDAFFPLSIVEKCMVREPDNDNVRRRYIGVDPARYGSDSTVITTMENHTQTRRTEIPKNDTVEAAMSVINEANRYEAVIDNKVLVDSTGIGAGVFDFLKHKQREGLLGKHWALVEIHFGQSPAENLEDYPDYIEAKDVKKQQESDKKHYANKKAKILDLLSRDMKTSTVLDSRERIYEKELPGMIFKFDSKGKMQAESKDDAKSRLGASPDSAESLAIANYGRHLAIKRERQVRVTVL